MSQNKSRRPFKEWSRAKKVWSIIGWSVAGVAVTTITVVGSYLGYVMAQYYRIEDNQDLTKEIKHGTGTKDAKNITSADELKILSYNIGFGAYDQEYDFFMDEGYMKDGSYICGTHSRALSYEAADRNTNGSVDIVKEKDVDFAIIQEVDTDSDRCYHINQYQRFIDAHPNHDALFSCNFHTAYLAYPFNEPIGKTTSGLVTLSKYNLETAIRRSYPVDNSFPNKFFDLDRSFSVTRSKLSNGKDLVIGNSHMSAYDEGGKIRALQLQFLCEFLKQEKEAGNYVILGGDFNHDIAHSSGLDGESESYFETDEKHPEWVNYLDESALPEGYHIGTSLNAPTCRAAEMPYTKIYSEERGDREDEKGKYYVSNYTVVIDGFICSENVKIKNVENLDLQFLYSDHNPVVMNFTLDI